MVDRLQEQKELYVNEQTTLHVEYLCTSLDGETPVTPGAITAMKLWLVNSSTGATINSVADVDISAEVDANGVWKHDFAKLDNVIVGTGLERGEQELHVALVQLDVAGAEPFTLNEEIEIYVTNLQTVPVT